MTLLRRAAPLPPRPALLAVAALLALAARAAAGPAAPPGPSLAPAPGSGEEPPPLLQLPADVRPVRYALDLEILPEREDGIRGRAEVAVVLERPLARIWLHARDLAVSEVTVEAAGGARVPGRLTQVHPSGVARLDLPRAVGPGPVTLRMAWSARWGPAGAGAFRAREGGELYASTQFEAVDARRAFPCFDEPRFKTPFEVTLTVPAGLVAISNAPERGSEPAAGGLRRVRFSATRPIPTYLVFWTVGPYDVVDAPAPPNEIRPTPLPVRYVVPRGRAADAAFAREAGPALLAELERWFGTPFPYPKLDHVVVPGFPLAMENPGAISYVESALLFDPRRQGPDERRSIADAMAHEMSHHWFGDLVTLPWWTEIWLNESFAQWMGTRAVQRWQPSWGADVAAAGGTARAMRQDELATTRAILKPLTRIEEVEGQFDGMSYEKGAALLGMVERWVGEAPFRDGIRRYLAAHVDGTGSTDALLAEISAAAGRDVAGPFRTFLSQPGVPRVEAAVACEGAAARVRLRQARALPRGSGAAPGGAWRIPVCLRYEAAGAVRERCTLLERAEATVALPEGCPAWLMPDAGAAGYYAWALAPADLARLRARGLARLSTLERLSFARAVAASERAGALPYADAMDALTALARDPRPEVAAEPIEALEHAHDWLVPPADRPAVEVVARRLYRPVLARLGWSARPAESSAVRDLRARVVRLLALTGRDPAVRREAARRGAAYAGVADGKLHPEAVDPELAPIALAVAVQERGRPMFEAVLARAVAAPDLATRERLLPALAAADDPDLARRFAAVLAADGLPLLERVDAVLDPHAVRSDPASVARRLALLEENLDAWAAALPPFMAAGLPGAARGACSGEDAARVEALFARRAAALPGVEPMVARAVERIRLCAAGREADAGPASAWFTRAARRGAPPHAGAAAR
ncbi:Peptidase M1 membrane alanine aminopeptidase [Anaeromyxobacter sp. K]|uniref:M1 family metallopeptidase n=1 Tax=Anaeromyxobacter sp. (strain K) TaxID=447217 RepID=UPI00015F8D3A|nr:M1 family metallopeptidase [Anaeromyxobacter sp. K]ACG74419.1 Peptidase M1 membrane alanine aminopeptidase [Anaeromyxobacter sp. K]